MSVLYTVVTAGRAAGANSSAVDKTVVIGYSIAGKAATVKLKLTVSIAAVYLGGNTVLVIVIIVVKHRARLLVSRIIVGI